MTRRHYHTLYFGGDNVDDVEVLRYLLAVPRRQRGRILKDIVRQHLAADLAARAPTITALTGASVLEQLNAKEPGRRRARSASPRAASASGVDLTAPRTIRVADEHAISAVGGRNSDLERGLSAWVK